MHVFIVYAHPSDDSFTRHVRDAFIQGLAAGGHTMEISDLYKMNFTTDMSEAEYLREANYAAETLPPSDAVEEQRKINRSDAIVFIYPVFWTEAPAKLVGWFDRVWTYGFAYGNRTMKKLKKALVLCVAGHTLDHLKSTGQYESMKTVMLGDRVYDRAEIKEMMVLDGTSKHNGNLRSENWDRHLQTAFEAGKSF
jgi:NAD(P)H dehydrogenase (quinone)